MSTVREVARYAQVSPATVSQLLNRRGTVGTETARRIEAAIQKLGYERRPMGRPRTRNPTYHFGFLIGQMSDTETQIPSLPRRRLASLRKALAETGDQLSVLPGDGHVDQNWAFQDVVENDHVQGVIITGHQAAHGYVEWLAECRVPLVVIDRVALHNEFSAVGVDNFQAGQPPEPGR